MNEAAILSDRQIRELCEKPVGVLRYTDSRYGPVTEERRVQVYADQTTEGFKERLNEYALKHGGHQVHGTRLTMYDVHSEDYHDHYRDFQPMIEPFSPHQIRENERNATEEEAYEIQRLVDKGFIHKVDMVTELQKKWPSIRSFRLDILLGYQILEKIVSYGLTSFGYDVRCGREFKIFTNINSTLIDPKNFDDKNFVDFVGDVCIIPPNSFVLARTMERFDLPRDIVADCVGKSTYARCGISIMVTPLEPEWDGYLTLEFANTTPLPAKLYAGEGCGQIRFFRGSEGCETSYRDRGGKYLGQTDKPVTPKM
jgi:dCTP deaminase